jgi:hypothetical protein
MLNADGGKLCRFKSNNKYRSWFAMVSRLLTCSAVDRVRVNQTPKKLKTDFVMWAYHTLNID